MEIIEISLNFSNLPFIIGVPNLSPGNLSPLHDSIPSGLSGRCRHAGRGAASQHRVD
jgi:hypothetical protein